MLHRQHKPGSKHDISVLYDYILDIHYCSSKVAGVHFGLLISQTCKGYCIRTAVEFSLTCTTHNAINLKDDDWGKTLHVLRVFSEISPHNVEARCVNC